MASATSAALGRGWLGRGPSASVSEWEKGPTTSIEPVKPAPESLSPEVARQYYNDYIPFMRAQLLGMKSRGAPAETIARRGSQMRNALAQRTRDVMANQELAKGLRPHRPLEFFMNKYGSEGFAGEALWNRIIEGALTPNPDVNAALGIKGPQIP